MPRTASFPKPEDVLPGVDDTVTGATRPEFEGWTDHQHSEFARLAGRVRRLDRLRAMNRPQVSPMAGAALPTLADIRANARRAWSEYREARGAVDAFRPRVDAARAATKRLATALDGATAASVGASADALATAEAERVAAEGVLRRLEARLATATVAVNGALAVLGTEAEGVLGRHDCIAALRKSLTSGQTGGVMLDQLEADVANLKRRNAEFLNGEAWPALTGREEQVVLVVDVATATGGSDAARATPPTIETRKLTRELFGRIVPGSMWGSMPTVSNPTRHDREQRFVVRLADLEG